MMEYWGYLTRQEHKARFTSAFPDKPCPGIDVFFSVGPDDIIRRIISDRIPVGQSDSEAVNLYDFYDEYLSFSSRGIAWLLPAMCKYVLSKRSGHTAIAGHVLFCIEDGFTGKSYDLKYLNKEQREALYNVLEYLSETYDLSVSNVQALLNSV